jgi:hypothetical protein
MCNKQDAVIEDPLGLGIPLQTYDRCDLMQIDNVALIFVQSMAYARNGDGSFKTDDGRPQPKAELEFNFDNFLIETIVSSDILESSSGIEGFRFNPTPQALTKVLFLDPTPEFMANVTESPTLTKYGDDFKVLHGGTLPVWELDGFYDQLQPIAQAFADHDQEQLLIDMMVVFHNHWPSRESTDHHQGSPDTRGYAWASDVRSYEPMVVEMLRKGWLLNSLVDTAPALNSTVVNGKTMPEIMEQSARHVLLPNPDLRTRTGLSSSTTSDGRVVNTLSVWQLIADGYALKDQVAVDNPTAYADWDRGTRSAVDSMVRGSQAGSVWTFSNPRFVGVSLAVTDYVKGRIAAHRAEGTLDAWFEEELPGDVERIFAGPVFAAAGELVSNLGPEARSELQSILAFLMNENDNPEAFATAITSLANVLQLSIDDADIVPVARVIGEALGPEKGWATAHIRLLNGTGAGDQGRGIVTELLGYLYGQDASGDTIMSAILDAVGEVHRVNPFADFGADYAQADYKAVLAGVGAFFRDVHRGFAQFVNIVENRKL